LYIDFQITNSVANGEQFNEDVQNSTKLVENLKNTTLNIFALFQF